MNNIESGKELGRYELLVPIAKGGMAQVWAARLLGTRGFTKLVAIKMILPGGMDNTRLEQMFLEEASLAALIHHPNVVETLELGEHEGTLYLVMEWVEGESLNYVQNRAQERGGLPLPVAVHLLGQACKGLHAAHELCGDDGKPLGIVHRDISPQNILVTYTGSAKIVDFGIAKATGRASTLTEAGEIKGKVSYMSPEQVKGDPLDRRSDLFALGILLYTLTTGRHPFKGSNPAETIKRIVCGELLARPSELVPGYPEKLEAVVLKALCVDVNERWASAQEMLAAMEDALPKCFDTSCENYVRQFLQELLGDRARERRAAVRLAQDALGGGKTPQTFSSLRALSVDRPGESSSAKNARAIVLTPQAIEAMVTLPPPFVQRKRRVIVAAASSALLLLGALGLGVLLSAHDPTPGGHAAASPVPTTTAPAVREPTTASAASTAPPPAAVESSEPAASADPKPKRAPRMRSAAPSAASAARAAGSTAVSASARAAPSKPSADAWNPNSFGSRH